MRNTADKIKKYLQKRPLSFVTDEAYQLATLKYAPDMADVIWEVKRAFEKGILPERSRHGTSSTFFLKDCMEEPIAVFKPFRWFHELAAYRLDYKHFAGVPQTALTTIESPIFGGKQTGSCQLFIKGSVTAVEVNRKLYKNFSASSIRRIAALDIRMMNEDRHSSNILVVDQKEAVPIDHGYILPHDLSQVHLVWLDWNQASTTFTSNELSYISLLDPEYDRRMLIEELCLEEIVANRLYVATVLLKIAAVYGMTPLCIGRLMARNKKSTMECSPFEFLIDKIRSKNAPNWLLFSRYVYDEVEKIINLYLDSNRSLAKLKT